VYARPCALDGPLNLDPDGPVAAIRHALRSLDGKFSVLAAGTSTAVLATDALRSSGSSTWLRTLLERPPTCR
jgi:hypothetical protein